MKNWRTTLFGFAAALPGLLTGIASGDWAQIGTAVGILVTGLFAKDAGKSGTAF